jgi:hypothetical protein
LGPNPTVHFHVGANIFSRNGFCNPYFNGIPIPVLVFGYLIYCKLLFW